MVESDKNRKRERGRVGGTSEVTFERLLETCGCVRWSMAFSPQR